MLATECFRFNTVYFYIYRELKSLKGGNFFDDFLNGFLPNQPAKDLMIAANKKSKIKSLNPECKCNIILCFNVDQK